MMKKASVIFSAAALLISSQFVQAAEITVSVQNLTQGMHFTPLLISAHDDTMHLFRAGEAASMDLQKMAEGGDISGLVAQLDTTTAVHADNPAGGLLGPSETSPATDINTAASGNDYLSIVAMILPTNDGFIGLDSWHIPSAAGTYTIDINGYDAGTEGNDELLGLMNAGAPGNPGMPGAPSGHAGTGGTGNAGVDTNMTVHIHRGNLGDTNPAGGPSDIDSRVHRWLNPVARVTVVVK